MSQTLVSELLSRRRHLTWLIMTTFKARCIHWANVTAIRLTLPVYTVDNFFLMGSWTPMLTVLGAYLLFVLKLGPMYMKNRPAYKLRGLLLAYNIFQVGFSLYICYIGTSAILDTGLSERDVCMMDVESVRKRVLDGHHLYFIAKLTEFLDTIFFVLRKKWNQLSFLHVYHHTIMYLLSWVGLKYEPSYTFIFLGTLNSFVHVVMYTYYALSAFPELERYLWWKKYITKLQLIQFVIVIVQIQWNTFVSPCAISYILLTVCWAHFVLFVYLFSDFYVKAYLKNKRDKGPADQRNETKKSASATSKVK